jgi:hypothetical protein
MGAHDVMAVKIGCDDAAVTGTPITHHISLVT